MLSFRDLAGSGDGGIASWIVIGNGMCPLPKVINGFR